MKEERTSLRNTGPARLGVSCILFVAVMLSAAMARAAAPTPRIEIPAERVREIAALLPERPRGPGRPIVDRAAWEALASRPEYRAIIKEAEALLRKPLPATSDDLYLEFSRTGNRTKWQDVNFQRRGRIDQAVLAECLEDRGRFLPMFTETLRAVCQERTWVMPAHDGGLANFHGKARDIDLASASLGWTLATADWLLADRLEPASRQLLREQVRQRVLEPFKEMVEGPGRADWWLTGSNNWNAVCLSGVTGAALALIDSREERAYYVAAAEKLSRNFLAGIPADGYCTEGVGYWNYGFGHYVLLAETILQATGGRVDLLQGEHVRRIAMYGLEIEIAPGVCPSFSDCPVNARPAEPLAAYIARRWGLTLPAAAHQKTATRPEPLYQAALYAFPGDFAATRPAPTDWAGPGPRSWFDIGGVLVARPGSHRDCRMAVALKGGHNAEEHNHNDVGSYIVIVDGRAVLVDPGAEVYTARTFSAHRYDSRVINSYGHPVPRVAGQLQRTGREARAVVLRTAFTEAADTLVLDLRSAYDVAALKKLERTFVYSREDGGSLTVTDEVAFEKPQAFGTALITFGTWRRLGPDTLRIEDGPAAVEATVALEGAEPAVQAEEIHENLGGTRTPVRIGIEYPNLTRTGRIRVQIRPAAAPPAGMDRGEAGR
ncbi:MAG: heparinase [Phycisphaerae bacterium]